MKAIKIYSKTMDRTADGRKCTPSKLVILFWGNILFSRKPFIHRWYVKTDSCFTLLGFRFTKNVYYN